MTEYDEITHLYTEAKLVLRDVPEELFKKHQLVLFKRLSRDLYNSIDTETVLGERFKAAMFKNLHQGYTVKSVLGRLHAKYHEYVEMVIS